MLKCEVWPAAAGVSDRQELATRACRITFSLRWEGRYRRVWVQETIPHQGRTERKLRCLVGDLGDPKDAQIFANELLWYLQTLGMVSSWQRLHKTELFALEVVTNLPRLFRLTALHVLLWLHRDVSGPDLVREVANDA